MMTQRRRMLTNAAPKLPEIGKALNDYTWKEIAAVSKAGKAAEYWSVGDRKAVEINGTVGGVALSGIYYCSIIGIDHNSDIEGKGIHFQFGYTALSGGKNIAFGSANYGSQVSGSAFIMNTSATNVGGWASSYMRNTICAGFLSALPGDLQKAITPCTKYTDNVGNASGAASNVTATEDKIWLLSEFETFGTRSQANSSEQSKQQRYSCFPNGVDRMKYKHDATGTGVFWWSRSPSAANNSYFTAVHVYGTTDQYIATLSGGFAPCFKV